MKVPGNRTAEEIHESRRVQRAAWAGLVVFAAVGALLYAWSGISSRRQVSEAITAIEDGRIAEAESLIARFSRTSPSSAESLYLSARLAYAKKQPAEILPLLAAARAKGYEEPPLERLLGLVYADAGRFGEAENRLQDSWDREDRPDPEVADALCRIYFQSYRFAPALRVIETWTRRAPNDLRALLWRAEIHSRNDAGAEAQIRDFDQILKRDPNQLRSRLNRASALRTVGRIEDAKRDYEIYLKAKPDDPEGHLGAAKTAEGLDDEDTALAHYERVLELNSSSVVALIGKASILIRRKEYEPAIALLDRAIKGEPNDPEPHYRKGQALDRLGKPEEAKIEFATRNRLRTEQEEIEKIRKGLVRNPNDVKLMAAAATWLLSHGYEEEGTTWADKVLAKEPRNSQIIKLLVDFYAKRGNTGKSNYYRLMLPQVTEG